MIVVEDLKGWRPKGPSKAMRQRFHRFQHRMLIQCVTTKAQELGIRMLEIHARGTSRWAFDGSGKLVRSKDNAQLATFQSRNAKGKRRQFNADLNAAYNIAARGLAMLLKIVAPRLAVKPKPAEAGKSSGPASRMPIVLADIWDHHRMAAAAHFPRHGCSDQH